MSSEDLGNVPEVEEQEVPEEEQPPAEEPAAQEEDAPPVEEEEAGDAGEEEEVEPTADSEDPIEDEAPAEPEEASAPEPAAATDSAPEFSENSNNAAGGPKGKRDASGKWLVDVDSALVTNPDVILNAAKKAGVKDESIGHGVDQNLVTPAKSKKDANGKWVVKMDYLNHNPDLIAQTKFAETKHTS